MKRSRIIAHQLIPIENPYTIDINSVTIEDPKTSHKISRAIKLDKKVSQAVGAGRNLNSILYSKTTELENFLAEIYAKITKPSNAHKSYARSYIVDILIVLVLKYSLKRLNLQLEIN